jgi:phosphoribosyl-dephospho-CoA transferase
MKKKKVTRRRLAQIGKREINDGAEGVWQHNENQMLESNSGPEQRVIAHRALLLHS